MASSDVRDVLNLPDGVAGGVRTVKKQKASAFRPNLKGLAREVQNLGGDNPIAIVPEASVFKKRRLASRKPAERWELRKFKNSGRDDQSLILRHWRRKDTRGPAFGQVPPPQPLDMSQQPAAQPSVEGTDGTAAAAEADASRPQLQGQAEGGQSQEDEHRHSSTATATADDIEDSAFSKFNVRVQVPQYTVDQYQVSLTSEDWTKEETDYLIGLASDFDLRWPIIWDRYEWNPPATNGDADVDGDESKAIVPTTRIRAVEDLKARYYEVAAKMMAAQKPVQYMTQAEYALHEVMAQFNPKQETLRKEFAMNTLSRSREEAREEESLLLEIKRILARSDRFNEDRRELYNRLDYPRAETDISSFKSSAGLQTLLQNLMNADKTKKRKSLMGAEGAGAAAQAGGSSEAGKPGAKGAAATSNAATRESTETATPTAAGKKGQTQEKAAPERRKLDGREEAIYGVSHHDRLTSGPTFRTEKINKLFSHKSNQQQLRINNTLNELDVPAKLAMPTTATTAQYEALLNTVNSLLDARKVSDKLEHEIMVEKAKKEEHRKAYLAAHPEEAEALEKEAKEKEEAEEAGKAEGATILEEQGKDGNLAEDETTEEKAGTSENIDAGINGETKTEDDDAADTTAKPEELVAENAEENAEGTDDKEVTAEKEKSTQPESSGPQKRSASVMSGASDKSSKRQKK